LPQLVDVNFNEDLAHAKYIEAAVQRFLQGDTAEIYNDDGLLVGPTDVYNGWYNDGKLDLGPPGLEPGLLDGETTNQDLTVLCEPGMDNGIAYARRSGTVKSADELHQQKGVRIGMRYMTVNREPYTNARLVTAKKNGKSYEVTFAQAVDEGAEDSRGLELTRCIGASGADPRADSTSEVDPDDVQEILDSTPELITTLMIRNMPTRLKQSDIVDELDTDGFTGTYDWLYMPSTIQVNGGNKGRGRSKGYAFVNFIKPEFAVLFKAKWHGQKRFGMTGRKSELDITVASVQGKENNIEQFMRGKPSGIQNSQFRLHEVAFIDLNRDPNISEYHRIIKDHHERLNQPVEVESDPLAVEVEAQYDFQVVDI